MAARSLMGQKCFRCCIMTSKTRRRVLLLFCLSASVFAAESARTPRELVDLSRRVSDLSTVGPYQLNATIVLNPGTSKETSGRITILRDKGLYHSDLNLPGYREGRWIKENTLYIVRTRPIPFPHLLVLRELDQLWRVNGIPDNINLKQSKEKDHGKPLECFESNQDGLSKFCFDSAISVLVRARGWKAGDIEFQEFGTFEHRYFPSRIIVKEQDRKLLEVRDITISKASFTPDMFDPPEGTSGFPTCEEITPPRKIKDVNPEIPIEDLRRIREAVVYLYGWVAADGSVSNISVEYSPGDSFTESARRAFQQWRYAPATCGGKTIPTEIETHVLYYVR